MSTPPNGNTQLAALSGNSTSFVVHQFDDQYVVGDRLMLAVYDSIVHEIPDFALSPPPEIAIPSTTTSPFDGPSFSVSRNKEFDSTVALSLHRRHRGDRRRPPDVGHPSRPVGHPAGQLAT